jgi:hypothetical protein
MYYSNGGAALVIFALTTGLAASPAQAQDKKPNIVMIMGDDIGWFNIGAYNQGIMAGRTPNIETEKVRRILAMISLMLERLRWQIDFCQQGNPGEGLETTQSGQSGRFTGRQQQLVNRAFGPHDNTALTIWGECSPRVSGEGCKPKAYWTEWRTAKTCGAQLTPIAPSCTEVAQRAAIPGWNSIPAWPDSLSPMVALGQAHRAGLPGDHRFMHIGSLFAAFARGHARSQTL